MAKKSAGKLYMPGDYSRRKGDLLGLRDVQKEFGPRATKTVASGGDYGRRQAVARQRALEGAPFAERFRSAYYVGNPTNVRPQNMTVAQRMELQSKKLLGEYSRKNKSAPAPAPAPAAVKVKAKPAQAVSTTVRERITPTNAKAKAPARMAVNPRTGSTLGFTTGTRTGSTSFKPGVAGKTSMTGMQRMSQNAFNKGGVAGPSRPSGGSSRSTGGRTTTSSRGDVGAGRRGGGR